MPHTTHKTHIAHEILCTISIFDHIASSSSFYLIRGFICHSLHRSLPSCVNFVHSASCDWLIHTKQSTDARQRCLPRAAPIFSAWGLKIRTKVFDTNQIDTILNSSAPKKQPNGQTISRLLDLWDHGSPKRTALLLRNKDIFEGRPIFLFPYMEHFYGYEKFK